MGSRVARGGAGRSDAVLVTKIAVPR